MPDHVIRIEDDLATDRSHWECDCGAGGSVPIELGDPAIAAERHVNEGESVSYRYPAR
jgi:hypothetical protein